MRYAFGITLLLFSVLSLKGQSRLNSRPLAASTAAYKIDWSQPGSTKVSDEKTLNFLNFKGAQYSFSDGFLPRYYENVTVEPGSTKIQVNFERATYENLTDAETALIRDQQKIP